MTITAYPLAWPSGRPRACSTAPARFRAGNRGGESVSLDMARDRAELQLTKLGATNVILSMNIKLTLTGRRDMNASRGEPVDVGAAIYFDLENRPHVLACDKWDRVADNIAAIAAHIEALRGQERWGVADLRQAFAGHLALPAPESWWDILRVSPTAPEAEIGAAYRGLAMAMHPDRGGDRDGWARVQAAYDQAKSARS
ncbi:MAG TPA: J domain-containing protein [Sphingomonas sp.]|jgi:hypothetical protein|uniref:J domain-containing protein n=1 Tax=Sphingomonas sp. TaxID=28214 RepID=UPI002EDB5000